MLLKMWTRKKYGTKRKKTEEKILKTKVEEEHDV
jgi:hypothetical protein